MRSMSTQSQTVMVYSSKRQSVLADLRRFIAYRELLLVFAQRDLKVKYKQTLLGILWAWIQPFMLMVVFSIVLGRVARVSSEGFPYPVFVYAGLLPWNYFSAVVASATNSVVQNQAIVTKVAFPREILPLFHIVSGGVDFLIGAVVFVAILVYYHISISWTAVFIAPLLLAQVFLMASIGLILAALNAYYRDVRHALPLALQVWMFSTPVVYSTRAIPESLQPLYLILNPMAMIVDGYRRVILHKGTPDLEMLAVLIMVMAVLFMGSYWIFKQVERNMADVV